MKTRLIARTPEKFRETGIDVRIDTRVEEVDPKEGKVRLADGEALPYDILVLGTGTTPLLPGIPGETMEGVFTLKKFTDAHPDQGLAPGGPLPEGDHRRGGLHRDGDVRGAAESRYRNAGLPPRDASREPLGPRILEGRSGRAPAARG